MASACVNNIGMSPENFLDCPPAKFSAYGWLNPRMNFGPDPEGMKASAAALPSPKKSLQQLPDDAEEADPEILNKDFVDFEFRLENSVTMLPADELFSDGKLVPLHLSAVRNTIAPAASVSSSVRSAETPKFGHSCEISSLDPYLFSPKAPGCSTRWKEILGLKKLYQNSNSKQEDPKMANSSSASHNRHAARNLKYLLHHRSSKSSLNLSIDSSLSLPLLKESENESASTSSRLSLSSSSSGHDHDDLPRLSLDSDKPKAVTRNAHHHTSSTVSKVRVANRRSAKSSENATGHTQAGRSTIRRPLPESTDSVLVATVDSPRMNASGKIVFHGLERSSSSPGSFNGGPRYKHRGMERSYSANVRVTPVLNVPVCSLRGSSKSGVFGFPLFSSPQKRDTIAGNKTLCKNRGGDRI